MFCDFNQEKKKGLSNLRNFAQSRIKIKDCF